MIDVRANGKKSNFNLSFIIKLNYKLKITMLDNDCPLNHIVNPTYTVDLRIYFLFANQ